MKINALFVETNGVYFNLENVEPYDIGRDAFNAANRPAICHPPCQRWGRYWSGGPSAKVKRKLGDDGGCFDFALNYVRHYGGIIEHPEASHAWKHFELNKPPRSGGWIKADDFGGLTCCVEQGHYGHKARKATWLYINKIKPIELIWGPSKKTQRVDTGFRSKEAAKAARARPDYVPIKRLTQKERLDTPIEFRNLLLKMMGAL
jgi:hypothetical protein